MTVEALGSCGSTVQTAVALVLCKQMRLDFFDLFSSITDPDLSGAQITLAAFQQDHGGLSNNDNIPFSSDSPCLTNSSVDQISWSVLLAGSLFASQEKKSASAKLYSAIGSGKRGMPKKQYKCSTCGNSVVVDQMLGPDKQECQICGAHLTYMGCAR